MKTLEWEELWTAMDREPDVWQTTTIEMYDAILGAVPPTMMKHGAFLGGEPNHHNNDGFPVYAAFRHFGESYQAKYMTLKEFKTA